MKRLTIIIDINDDIEDDPNEVRRLLTDFMARLLPHRDSVLPDHVSIELRDTRSNKVGLATLGDVHIAAALGTREGA